MRMAGVSESMTKSRTNISSTRAVFLFQTLRTLSSEVRPLSVTSELVKVNIF